MSRRKEIYWNTIKNNRVFTADEQPELNAQIKLAQEGDDKAMRIVIDAHLRLVVDIARKMHVENNHMDAVQQGNLALMRCVMGFNPSGGAKFSHYAYTAIQYALWQMHSSLATVSTPRTAQQPVVMCSIDDRGMFEEDYHHILPDNATPDPSDMAEHDRRIDREALIEYVAKRPYLQREVWKLRMGLGGGRRLMLRECAEIVGKSYERIRQIEVEELERARKHFQQVPA